MQTGPVPLVTARLPRDHAAALRAFAARNGTTLNDVLKSLVADWFKVHGAVYGKEIPHAARPVSAAPAIPATARPREETGKAEPAAVLQAIDIAREADSGKPPMRD